MPRLTPFLAAFGALFLVACGGGSGPGGGDAIRFAEDGTQIELSNIVDGVPSSTVITVADASGTEGRYLAADGSVGTFFPGCWGCGGEMQIEREVYDTLWPLQPGNSVSFLRTGPGGDQAQVTIRVTGRERVETPAGFFETKVLSSTIESRSGDAWSAEMRTWWSEQLGWAVRSQGNDSRGTSIFSEIVRVSPP